MHPLVARIHPGLRTAMLAWLLSRVALWGELWREERLPWFLFQGGMSEWDLGGSPLSAALVYLLERLPDSTAGWVVLGVAELIWFGAILGIYGLARRNELPQTAERATWLWALCPVVALVGAVPSAWSLACCLGVIALGAAARGHHIGSMLAVALAVGLRLEALLVWPGLVALGWRPAEGEGQVEGWRVLGLAVTPPAAFTLTIVAAINCGGMGGVSIRSLQPTTAWRQELIWQGVNSQLLVEVGLVLALILGFGLWATRAKQHSAAWPLLLVPCLLWPLSQIPSQAALPTVLWAVPLFVLLAARAHAPGVERAILLAVALSFVVLV